MKSYSLSHLSDHTLLRDLVALLARDRTTTAALLAHLAEVDARQLYRPAAYPSMYAYCVGELRLCEQAAFKRIRAARTARQFPAIFEALAQGRLHLSAVVLLAPYLTPENAHELLAAATHKTSLEVEHLIAARFPRLDLPVLVRAVAGTPTPTTSPAPTGVPGDVPALSSRTVDGMTRGPGKAPSLRPTLTPLASERYALQLTINQSAHDKLRYAQTLMGHQLPSGDLAALFERALDALIPQLEQAKFAGTARPRTGHVRFTASPRHIPAHVKRTVWERDQGRCTFVSDTGRRCPARTRLEFDHIEPVARGGEATVTGIRLRCRAHNQYAAECAFGTEFMRRKRLAAAEARAAAKGQPATETPSAAKARPAAAAAQVWERKQAAAEAPARERERMAAAAQTPEREQTVSAALASAREQTPGALAREHDVVPWLRALGFSAAEARRAAALCEDIPDASLEERVRRALSCFHVRGTRVVRPVADQETVTRGYEAGAPAAC